MGSIPADGPHDGDKDVRGFGESGMPSRVNWQGRCVVIQGTAENNEGVGLVENSRVQIASRVAASSLVVRTPGRKQKAEEASDPRGRTVRNVLLLTATINPSASIPTLARRDPAMRRMDYEKSLSFYVTLLGRCFDAIVLCENSGADLSSLRAIAGEAGRTGQVEFVSYKAPELPSDYGRAYAELLLIDHALKNAENLREQERRIVWKCTGRYLVRNMERLVVDQPREFDLYCHKRDRPYSLCELYMLAWNDKGYRVALDGIAPMLRESPEERRVPETIFRSHLDRLDDQIKVVSRFRHVPLITANRGWNNTPYSDKLWDPKILIREAALRFAPWIWI